MKRLIAALLFAPLLAWGQMWPQPGPGHADYSGGGGGGGSTPPTFDVAGSNVASSAGTTLATASTTVGSDTNGIAVACVGAIYTGTVTISSVVDSDANAYTRLGGTTMTSDGVNWLIDVWTLNDPAAGAGKTVTMTTSGSSNVRYIGVQYYSGRNTSAPLGSIATNTAASGTSVSTSVTSATNDLVVGCGLAFASSTPTDDLTVHTPGTSRWTKGEQVVEGSFINGSEWSAGSGTTAIQFDRAGSPNGLMIAGVALKAH